MQDTDDTRYIRAATDHDRLVRLDNTMPEVRADIAEIKTMLKEQNGRVRKLEERWWIAMGALLAASTIVNWALFQLMPNIARALAAS